jgi:SAM-dependent methyltransferase
MSGSYVQFGCGTCAPAGWRNFDAGPAFWLQKYIPFSKSMLVRRGYPDYPVHNIEYGDIIVGLPVESNSAAVVYCSHVLEHLALSEFRCALRNIFIYLKAGGRFRLVVPDLEYLVHQYCKNPAPEAASIFLRAAVLGEASAHRGLRSLPQLLFGRSKHLWMWDYKAIVQELADAGFSDMRRAFFNDSEDHRFSEVENRGRWENCLGVECRKP